MIWLDFLEKYEKRNRKDFQYYDLRHKAWGILGAVDFTWGLVAVEIDATSRHDYIPVYDLIDPLDKPLFFVVRHTETDVVAYDGEGIVIDPDTVYEISVMAETVEYHVPSFEEDEDGVFANGLKVQFEVLWAKRYDRPPTKSKIAFRFKCKGTSLIGSDLKTYGDFLRLEESTR